MYTFVVVVNAVLDPPPAAAIVMNEIPFEEIILFSFSVLLMFTL